MKVSEYFLLFGFIFLFLGFISLVIGTIIKSQEQPSGQGTDNVSSSKPGTKVDVAFGGFIGPVPFGFATSKALLYIMIALSLFFFIVWFAFRN